MALTENGLTAADQEPGEEVFGDSQDSAGGEGGSRNLTCEDVKKNRRREKVAAVSADDSFEVFRVMIYQEAEQ